MDQNEYQKGIEERDDLRGILASISEGILVVDRAQAIRLMNVAAGVLLRVAPAEVIGKNINDVFSYYKKGKSGVEKGSLIERAIERTNIVKTTFADNYWCKNAAGQEFPLGLTVTTLLKEGKNSGAIVVFRDVTEEKRVDEAKSEFVALAAHQLRTPLASINWYAEMLLAGDVGRLKTAQKNYIDQVYRAGRRMAELVRLLLNVSRIDLGSFVAEPKAVDIRETVKNVLEEGASQIATKKLVIDERYDERARVMQADPQLLLIILQNILSNAIKYTPAGGRVGIDVRCDEAGGGTEIKISDSGFGIPAAEQASIFTKMYRASNVKNVKGADGTGLGLYVIKAIIEEVGGSIRFESTEGKGTAFFVHFPASGMERRSGTKHLS